MNSCLFPVHETHSEKRYLDTLKGKELLSKGEKSFLLDKTSFQKGNPNSAVAATNVY